MHYNLGGTDVLVRISMGLGIIGAGFYFHNWAGLLGLLLFISAVMGVCPIYRMLGISTYRTCRACGIVQQAVRESQEGSRRRA